MKNRKMKAEMIEAYEIYLRNDEKSRATREKYVRDVKHFAEFAGDRKIDKDVLLDYKESLEKDYAMTSANSMIAAVNSFLRYADWHELCIKQFKIQKDAYSPQEKELSQEEFHTLIKPLKRTTRYGCLL